MTVSVVPAERKSISHCLSTGALCRLQNAYE